MASIKFTGLPAGAAPFDNASVFALSEDDTGFSSVKVTLTQVREIVYAMEAEQEITFNSTGTNRQVISDSTGTQAILMHATGGAGGTNQIGLSANGLGTFDEGFMYVHSTGSAIGFDDDGTFDGLEVANAQVQMVIASGVRFRADATGLGFFGSTPIAKPAITGSRGGNAALADLLTDLASYGLITDSTSA